MFRVVTLFSLSIFAAYASADSIKCGDSEVSITDSVLLSEPFFTLKISNKNINKTLNFGVEKDYINLRCETKSDGKLVVVILHYCGGIYSSNYHPKRKLLGDREAKRFHHVNQTLNETYKEIITSFQQGLSIVTSMGVRALLEGICVLEGIDDKTAWGLEKKIEKLKEVSNIPESIIEGLKGIKFVGDDAAHRLSPPEKHILSMAIDLLESLMTHMYEAKVDLENKAKILQETHNKSLKPQSFHSLDSF